MDDLVKKISSTLKTLRGQRGWSLDTASQKTGVSKAMLGQIERGESSPTLATLWKIASGFDVSFSSFVEDLPPYGKTPLHRAGHLQHVHPKDDKILVMPLFPYDASLKFEVFIIELLPGCEHISPPHQQGVREHIIVAQGSIEVFINGIWRPIQQHEGLRFHADQPHGYRNVTDKKAIFHDMIHYMER